jgi:prolyl oligopeptidase
MNFTPYRFVSLLTLSLAGCAQMKTSPTPSNDDPYLWLEDIDGAKAMEWVKARNAVAVTELASSDEFKHLRDQILEVLDSEDRIPDVWRMGDWLYNFWKDKEHPRGLWRRTTLDQYRRDKPDWEVLVDVDALGKAEKESWVWHAVTCLKPEYRHCLVLLSRGGADAQVVREYDLVAKSFVKEGFTLPEAKTDVDWIDPNTIYVGTDFGPGSMTVSTYPRIAKEWKRGTPLSAAKTVYEGKPDDLAIGANHDATPGFERDFVTRALEFFKAETYLRGKDGKLTLIDVPLDAETNVNREWLLVRLRTPWTVGGKTFSAGSLLATNFDDFMAGKRDLVVLFEPTDRASLSSFSWTRRHLILNELEDVSSRVEVLTPGKGPWKREPLGAAPPLSTVEAGGADPDRTDEYFLRVTAFLTPTTLSRGVLGMEDPKPLKHMPAFFDATGLDVRQYFTASKDGTQVPYFVIGPKNVKADGKNPTLLNGYGGFEISMAPAYDGMVGRAWLARGGVYAVANIRGGGEYGPRWHEAALKANRPRAYEDFAAVAQDLISRKITSPEHLATEGGSNGGLLMGNMITHYPQLFGAVACMVPLLDMKRYTHLSAGASWIAEYGDPDKPEEWAFIQKFSAYQNVRKGEKYPPILFITSTRDDRVGPVHARKMAAKMLDWGYDVRVYENIEGGHGAAADNQQAAFMRALAYSFLWNRVK